jgi:hypothetical protein
MYKGTTPKRGGVFPIYSYINFYNPFGYKQGGHGLTPPRPILGLLHS